MVARTQLLSSLPLMLALLFFAGSGAAQDVSPRCEATIDWAAGNYSRCLLAAKSHNALRPDASRLERREQRCADRFDRATARALARAERREETCTDFLEEIAARTVSYAEAVSIEAGGDAAASLLLYVFDCGEIQVDEESVAIFSLTSEEAGTDILTVPCYLIEHPEGRLIWDAGVPAELAEQEGWQTAYDVSVRLDRTLADQLQDLGLSSTDIDSVAFSHMHWDHVAQANQFTSSTHLIQRPEHAAAFVPEPTVPYFDPALYGELAGNKTVLLDGDHDVFGDGRVVIKSTPGHTPGHQSLYVELAETGPIVLSGDLYHFAANRELGRVPTFNYDEDQTRESMAELDAFLEERGAELWIEHDSLRETKRAPEFYR